MGNTMAEEKKEEKEKGVVGTSADVGKGAVKGTVSGTKKIGGAIGNSFKKKDKEE